MAFPLLTVLDRLDLPIQGISPEIQIEGVRFASGDCLREGMLYLRQQGEDCLLLCGDVRMELSGSIHLWFNRISECMDRFRGWELRFRDALLTRKLNDAMGLLAGFFGNAVYMVDASFRVLAIDTNEEYLEYSANWKHLVLYGYIPYHLINGMRQSGEMEQLRQQRSASLFFSRWFNHPFINCCLFHGEDLWGHLFVIGYRRNFTRGDLAFAGWVSRLLESVLPQYTPLIHSRGHDHEAFFLHVLERSLSDPDQICAQLQPLGWEEQGLYQVAVFRADDAFSLLSPLLCDKLEQRFSCRALVWKDMVLAVFPVTQPGDGVTQLVAGFARQESLVGGISDVFDGFHRLPLNTEQAFHALEQGSRDSGMLTAYRYVALNHLFRNLRTEFDRDVFCDKSVFRLREYDACNGSDYLRTLEAYLRHERKLVDTAAALFIHRNTLVYRIERIRNLTGLDLEDPDVRTRVLLSCALLFGPE